MSIDSQTALNDHQRQVLQCLRKSNIPLSAYKILQALADTTINAPQQVYRALEKLADLHLVHRIESLNAYVACTHDCAGQHQSVLALCQQCQASFEFTDPLALQTLQQRAENMQFATSRITVEIFGLCQSCQQQQTSG